MVCKKTMLIICPVKSLTRLYHVGIPEVCGPSNDVFFLTCLTKSYRPSTIFYMDLRETTSPTQGALRLPSLALPGSHSPRGGTPINANLAGCFESAGGAR